MVKQRPTSLVIWLACGWLMVVTVVVLYLMPAPHLALLEIDWSDKAIHALTYATLMWWFAQAYEKPRWINIAVAFLVLGVCLEGIQSLLPYRTASGLDVIANISGIVFGWASALIVRVGFVWTTSSH